MLEIKQSNGAALKYQSYYDQGNINNNTFSGNNTTSTGPVWDYDANFYSNSIYVGTYPSNNVLVQPTINNNNIINEGSTYSLFAGTNAFNTTINCENNYWGTTVHQDIIYDFNDNFNFATIDYEPYLSTPNTSAPISPPANVLKESSGSAVVLTWDANPESDLAGYKIHYGNFTGYSYNTTIDLGNVTTYTLLA